ncbi:MAG: tetratricopeptide repeat protein [Sphingomonadaceae bacterium]
MQFTLRAALVLAAVAAPGMAVAQSADRSLDGRVGKLEKELKAVQRTVFPQGVPVEPETGAALPGTAAGSPASTPIIDLTARVDALEKSLAALTGQVEQAVFRNRQQDEAIAKLEARLAGPGDAAATAPAPETPTVQPATITTPPRPTTTPPSARTDAARKAAIAAVEIPATGDAIEDAYSYGFRLYTAKLFPEAQAKLKDFVATHPRHRRASFAQNLLGRAYLDEGKPALASVAFYDNYQKMPKGERAPESLYWLGQALTKLNKLPDACKVYAEFGDVYGATAPADLRARVAKARADAKCAG